MIGMDIGTTRSKVAYIEPTGKPSIVPNRRGEEDTPSVLHIPASGNILVGRDAIEQGFLEPDHCLKNFKLKLGSPDNLLQNGNVVTATDASAMLVGKLKEDVERLLNQEITEVVATCPANFRDDAKQALLEAFTRNGLKVLKLIPEPTAAGIAYALEKQGGSALFAVYDFGGGTFDASITKMERNQVDVLATEGVAKLGGNDFNECIETLVLNEVETKYGQRPTPQQEPLLFHDLSSRIEAAKISLGSRPEVPLVIGYQGSQVVVKISQDWFHQAIDPLIDESLAALDRAIASAGLKPGDLKYLVLVGGTSRCPRVQERVADHTGLYPKVDIDPAKAIAYGGALASVAEMAKQGRNASIRGRVIPAPDLFYRDVTVYAVGCCVVENTGPKKRMVNAVVISKNSPIPTQKTEHYYLEREDQAKAQIEILQGEPDANRDDCLLIGELLLDNLPPEQKRSRRIQVDFTIDSNGMVNVTATDKVSGKTQTVSVDYKKGIKPKDKLPRI